MSSRQCAKIILAVYTVGSMSIGTAVWAEAALRREKELRRQEEERRCWGAFGNIFLGCVSVPATVVCFPVGECMAWGTYQADRNSGFVGVSRSAIEEGAEPLLRHICGNCDEKH